MARRRQDERRSLDEAPANNPFRALLGGRSREQGGDPRDDAATSPETRGTLRDERVEIRVERKGNGGKTVTVVRWLDGAPEDGDLATLARELGRSLGAGVRAKDGVLRAQGDQARAIGTHFEESRGAGVIFGTTR